MAVVQIAINGFSEKQIMGGNTYYNPTQSFTVPENDGISSAVITYVESSGGNFEDKSAQLNATRAYAGWVSSGVGLNTALLSAGSNSFRWTFRAGNPYGRLGISSAVLTITYTPKGGAASLPVVSNLSVDYSTNAIYRAPNTDVILRWLDLEDPGNKITSFTIASREDFGQFFYYGNTIQRYFVVKSNGTAGAYRQYIVIANAPLGNGEKIAPWVYTYSSPTAPSSVVVSPSSVYPGGTFTLSWEGASAGLGVDIAGYNVYQDGAYVGYTTGNTYAFNAPSIGTHQYKIISIGSVSGYNSGYSAEATLTVLANPSLVSPNKWSMAPLESVGSTLTVYNNAYTHNITYSFHGSTASHNLAAGVNTHDFTFPEAWLASRTTSATGSLVITVSTYSGATLIGTKAITITINIPSSYGPTIGTLTATLVKNGGPESIDRYIKGISKATLEAGAFVYQYGAYAVGFSITGGGYSTGANPDTFGVFPTAGTITFTAAVLDSRGFTTSKQVSIIVQEYSSPTLSGVDMFRCDEFGTADSAGEYVSLKATSVFSSVDGQNTATLQGRVYMRGGTPGAWTDMTSGAVLLLGGGLLSIAKTYISEIKITDKIGNYAISAIIPTDSGVGLHIIDGSLGAAIGKYAEREKFFELPDDWTTNVNADKLDGYHASDLMFGIPNLLHNWDFTNPVNQRGASGAISSGYFYDRWFVSAGTITIASGYLSIPNAAAIEQRIEGNALAGKAVTISVMIADVVYSGTGTFPASAGSVDVTITDFGTAAIGYAAGYMYVRYTANATRQVQAVKLELGAVSTLHLDPPMDYGTELLKCQRFCLRLGQYPLVYGYANSTTSGRIYIPTPVQMRINPTLSLSIMFFTTVVGGKDCTAGSFTVMGNGVWAGFSGTGLTAQTPVTGYIGYAGEVIFLYSDL